MALKVLITDGLESVGKDIISQKGEAVDKKGIEAAELLTIIPEYDAVIVRGRTKLTAEVIAAASKLKVIGRMGVGVDNIDLAAAKDHDITVVNCAVATSVAVAELTMGLMLSLIRSIPRADATMKAETWKKKEFNGSELYGKTLGVIGCGNIGRIVIKYSLAFGMRVLACETHWNPECVKDLAVERASLEEIFTNSDFISLHLPLTPENSHLLNEAAFAMMKDGVFIVDAARGGLLDEDALLRALNSGKVAGAALDVLEKEPPLSWELVKHPQVIALPHIGAQTQEAQLRAAVDISTEVMNALEGLLLRWKIV